GSAAWPPGGRGRRHGWPRLGTDWGPAATTAPPAQKCAWCSPPGPWTWRRNWGATGRDPRGRQLATAWLQPAPGTAAGTAPRGWRPGPVPPCRHRQWQWPPWGVAAGTGSATDSSPQALISA